MLSVIENSLGTSIDLLLDLELLKEGVKANFAVSNDQSVACSNFATIAQKALDEKHVSDRIKLLAGNRLVVSSYRFSRDQGSRAKAREIATQLLVILNNLANDFLSQLYKSIVFRGIAMISEWGKPRQTEYNTAHFINEIPQSTARKR